MIRSKHITRSFCTLYYWDKPRTWANTYFLGVPIWKCPLDLWIYQELIYKIRPDLIIETGTAWGGSALYLATLCDIVGKGKVISIDIGPLGTQAHPRIMYLTGSSVDSDIVNEVRGMIKQEDVVMTIFDSDHSRSHVLAEMRAYGPMITSGSYMIVEESHVNGYPNFYGHGMGPMEAIEDFMKEDKDFVIDEQCEKFYLTFNPRGYLKKK